jgi:membrane protein implicated in regulation of membrane protease activity
MNEIEFMFWHWWGLSLLFLVIEVLVPSFFFLWLAAAGFVTGAIVWLFVMTTNVQLFIFSVLAISAIMLWKIIKKRPLQKTDHPLLNKRGQQYIDRTFNLYEAIENGQGKIKVDDSIWKVHGEDCAVGSKVRVIAVRGTVFDVEKVI